MTKEEQLKESLKFLDCFGVDYKGEIMYQTDWGNSVVMNNAGGKFHEAFIGYSINSITQSVAEQLNKKLQWAE